jgi:hypothetical protein
MLVVLALLWYLSMFYSEWQHYSWPAGFLMMMPGVVVVFSVASAERLARRF